MQNVKRFSHRALRETARLAEIVTATLPAQQPRPNFRCIRLKNYPMLSDEFSLNRSNAMRHRIMLPAQGCRRRAEGGRWKVKHQAAEARVEGGELTTSPSIRHNPYRQFFLCNCLILPCNLTMSTPGVRCPPLRHQSDVIS